MAGEFGLEADQRIPALAAAQRPIVGVFDRHIPVERIRQEAVGCFLGASSYGTIGKSEAAYFRMLNDQGGVNGRKINFISYDGAYSPPKTVEQVRKLVEEDGVLLMLAAFRARKAAEF